DERIADDVGKGSRASGGKAQHLKAMGERSRVAPLAAIFDVVMDRMVVGRDSLERGEIGVGDGSARDVEALAEREILEIAALREAVAAMVEFFGHCDERFRRSRGKSR